MISLLSCISASYPLSFFSQPSPKARFHSFSTSTTFCIIKMKPSTFFALLSALAPGVLSEFLELEVNFVPTLDISILDQPCVGKFMDPKVPTFVYYDELEKRQTEPDPDRNVTLQDDLVFVLQCVNAGFREPCTVFGAPPGACGKSNISTP